MKYAELRSANADAYRRQSTNWLSYQFGGWGGDMSNAAAQMQDPRLRNPQSLFSKIHDVAIQELAKQRAAQPVDWTQSYACVKPLLESESLVHATESWLYRRNQEGREDGLVDGIRRHHSGIGRSDLTRVKFDVSTEATIDPAAILATIISAVVVAVCPVAAPFMPILITVITAIVKVLFAALTNTAKTAYRGASAAFNACLQQWAVEAAAA